MLKATDNQLFCTNTCSLSCIALLTTDGAIFNSRQTGDRLLAVWHKIKIQILLEKLTLNRTPQFSVYHVSRAWAMIRKTFQHRRKSFCLQKCLSIYGRWLMCLFSRKLILIRGMDHKSRSWGGACNINLKWWVIRYVVRYEEFCSGTSRGINMHKVSVTAKWHFS